MHTQRNDQFLGCDHTDAAGTHATPRHGLHLPLSLPRQTSASHRNPLIAFRGGPRHAPTSDTKRDIRNTLLEACFSLPESLELASSSGYANWPSVYRMTQATNIHDQPL
jgi:hypothetical protein